MLLIESKLPATPEPTPTKKSWQFWKTLPFSVIFMLKPKSPF
ncbi:hypothetical protein PROVRUST_05041 [Providencia rustigianii DSM 4541]|uniref:Uncharacterized protein n=1 Tax=Providencia rustigianii DSM 4541 TaxID=500637 RepID=D1NZ71_9GAMM|nr:hypothetical protein PROVRUST_05041 [Providencia rustigianii DSM 4541]